MRKFLVFSMLAVAVWAATVATPDAPAQDASDHGAKRDKTPPEDQKEKLLNRLKSPEFEDRLAALHELVGHDRSLPVLRDAKVRAALIDLLSRESKNAQSGGLDERLDFQYYYGFLLEAVRKIATDYKTPEAWKSLVYSGYGPDSELGAWILKQPESYPLLLAWVDDKDFRNRHQALWALGYICANNAALSPKILRVLRDRIGSSDTWTQQGSMMGLGVCGTADDIDRLRKLPACSNQWNVKILCRQIEGKISKRLAATGSH